jgi:hypothetical protein
MAISKTKEPFGYMAILAKCGHIAILPYGYMALNMADIGVYQKSNSGIW